MASDDVTQLKETIQTLDGRIVKLDQGFFKFKAIGAAFVIGFAISFGYTWVTWPINVRQEMVKQLPAMVENEAKTLLPIAVEQVEKNLPNLVRTELDKMLPTAVRAEAEKVLAGRIATELEKVQTLLPEMVAKKAEELVPLLILHEVEKTVPSLVKTEVRSQLALFQPASGRIVSPQDESSVDPEFTFEAQLLNPNPNKYYYLANEISGMYWPKVRLYPLPNTPTIRGQSNQGGNPPNREFHIVLFEVDQEQHKRIFTWLNGTDFPGIQIDGRLLDRHQLKLR